MRGLALRSSHMLAPRQRGPILDLDLTAPVLDPRIVFSRSSPRNYFDSTGTLQAAANDTWPVEYDPVTLALLGRGVWQQAANAITNPRCEGAVVGTLGSGGAFPTGWGGIYSGGTGMTAQIIGTGYEAGIPYLDVRFFGTPTTNNAFYYDFMPLGTITSSPGQNNSSSFYATIIGGSSANFTPRIVLLDYKPGTGQLSSTATVINLLSGSLRTNRFWISNTSVANTTSVIPRLAASITAGSPVDVTLRIGSPQAEIGLVPTSPILPPIGSPGVSSRSPDNPSISPPAQFNSSAFSICAENMVPIIPPSGFAFVFSVDYSPGGRVSLSCNGPIQMRAEVQPGAVAVVNVQPSPAAGLPVKSALSLSASKLLSTYGGAAPLSSAVAGTIPGPNAPTVRLGYFNNGGPAQPLNGFLKHLTIWNRALAPAELQGVTT